MEKTLEDYFADWEMHLFGYGYGSGEPHVLGALKRFLALCPEKGSYDYQKLEAELGGTTAWLLINALCHADLLEYGTSPRGAWLTATGRRLKAFVDARSVEELCGLTSRDGDYVHCWPDACNCGPDGHEEGRVCPNPFWRDTAHR